MGWRATRIGGFLGDTRFLVFCGWLAVIFLFGGGSRGDIGSLLFLRPAALLIFAYGLSSLSRQHVAAHRFLFALAAAVVGLLLLQLVPLPPELWRQLPGRDIVIEVDRAATLGDVWRPISLVPYATRNALWALIVPLSVLVLGAQLSATHLRRLLALILALGLATALIALLQILGDPKGWLYFYRVTNNGSAVGLFANRNHQAVFLATLAPMLLVWVSFKPSESDRSNYRQARLQRWLVPAAAVAFVVPLILITGSRSGLVLALIALLSIPILTGARSRRRLPGGSDVRRERLGRYIFLGGIAAIFVLTIFLGRAAAIDRLLEPTIGEDLRLRTLPLVLSMIATYAPWGSGAGTFEQVFKVHETYELLRPTYANHAHNDWLEVALTGGVPAALLLALAVAAFIRRGLELTAPKLGASDEGRLARLGLLIILLLGLASVSDYPLRVPSLACLAVVAALWAGLGRGGAQSGKAGIDD